MFDDEIEDELIPQEVRKTHVSITNTFFGVWCDKKYGEPLYTITSTKVVSKFSQIVRLTHNSHVARERCGTQGDQHAITGFETKPAKKDDGCSAIGFVDKGALQAAKCKLPLAIQIRLLLVLSLKTDGSAADLSLARRSTDVLWQAAETSKLEMEACNTDALIARGGKLSIGSVSFGAESYDQPCMDVIGQVELTLRRFSDSGGIDHASPEELRAHLFEARCQARECLRRETHFPLLGALQSHPSGTSMLVSRSATRVSRLK